MTKNLLAQALPDKLFGTKYINSVKSDRTRNV